MTSSRRASLLVVLAHQLACLIATAAHRPMDSREPVIQPFLEQGSLRIIWDIARRVGAILPVSNQLRIPSLTPSQTPNTFP